MKKKTSAHLFAVPFFKESGLTLIPTVLLFSTHFESHGQRDRAISLDFLYERKQTLHGHLFGGPAAYFKNAIKTEIGFLRTFPLMSVEPWLGRFSVPVTDAGTSGASWRCGSPQQGVILNTYLPYAVIE